MAQKITQTIEIKLGATDNTAWAQIVMGNKRCDVVTAEEIEQAERFLADL